MKFGLKLFRPRNRKFTILIVPEGTSPVFRLKIKSTLLAMIMIAAVTVISLALVLFLINRNHAMRIVTLETELTTSTASLQSTVDDKEQAIDTLLKELLELSEKSKSIESKMLELEKLEAELKAITSGGRQTATTASPNVTVASEPMDQGGVGGESIPLTEDDILSLVSDTKESIAASLSEMPELQNRLEQTKINVEQYKEMMRILPTFWPTDSTRVTSEFGKRNDPFNRRLAAHNGIDVGGNTGDPIYAAADGKVMDTGYNSARGNYITLSHPSGLQTVYMHLSKVIVEKGDTVKQGDTIGALGSTGRSTGPHLHFEVIKNGKAVDPATYLTIPGKEE